jgi:hypothetical protein
MTDSGKKASWNASGAQSGTVRSHGRLYKQGNFVVLSAGKNFAFDELFVFEDAPNARAFYETGYSAFESFIGDDDEGYGFQEVALYRDGRRIARKSCAPTSRDPTRRSERKETECQSASTATCFCSLCLADNLLFARLGVGRMTHF